MVAINDAMGSSSSANARAIFNRLSAFIWVLYHKIYKLGSQENLVLFKHLQASYN